MKINLTNICTALHTAGFEAFVRADEKSILTNCPSPDFTFSDGTTFQTGLVVKPHTFPGSRDIEPGWYQMYQSDITDCVDISKAIVHINAALDNISRAMFALEHPTSFPIKNYLENAQYNNQEAGKYLDGTYQYQPSIAI